MYGVGGVVVVVVEERKWVERKMRQSAALYIKVHKSTRFESPRLL